MKSLNNNNSLWVGIAQLENREEYGCFKLEFTCFCHSKCFGWCFDTCFLQKFAFNKGK